MELKLTEKTTNLETRDNQNKEIILEDVPIYVLEDTGEELITLADTIRADERRIAKKYNINVYNIFELALLHADVKQRMKGIRQQFRFNKMLFYIWKKLKEAYGEGTLIFDKMGAGRAGPIPANLGKDIKKLKDEKLISIYITKEGKKIPGSKFEWEELKKKNIGGIECELTKKGVEIALGIWEDLDDEIKEIIVDVKKMLFLMDKDAIKDKVHKEFPEYKMNYTKNDEETFEPYLF